MTIQRGIDPRGFALLSFRRRRTGAIAGGDGIARHEGLHRAAEPGQPLGLRPCLPSTVRTDHIVTKVMHEDNVDLAAIAAHYTALEREAVEALVRDGIDLGQIRIAREADIRYAGQSMEVRVAAPGGEVNAAFLAGLIDAFKRRAFAHLSATTYAGQQKIELVNFLRLWFRPDRAAEHAEACCWRRPSPRPRASARSIFAGRFHDTADLRSRHAAARLHAGRTGGGRGISAPPRWVFPGQHLAVDPYGILIVRAATEPGAMNIQTPPGQAKPNVKPWPTAPQKPATEVDPIILQIVEGTLNSIEAEIEVAIERTARSPMIREAHDYRVGLFEPLLPQAHRPFLIRRCRTRWYAIFRRRR